MRLPCINALILNAGGRAEPGTTRTDTRAEIPAPHYLKVEREQPLAPNKEPRRVGCDIRQWRTDSACADKLCTDLLATLGAISPIASSLILYSLSLCPSSLTGLARPRHLRHGIPLKAGARLFRLSAIFASPPYGGSLLCRLATKPSNGQIGWSPACLAILRPHRSPQ